MRKVYIILRIKINRLIEAETYKFFSKSKINFIIGFSLSVRIDSLGINFILEEDFEIDRNGKGDSILTVKS